MARRKQGGPAIGDNAIDPEVIGKFTGQIENALEDLATAKAEYMRQARGIRDEINGIYGEAKDAGIGKRAFKSVIRARGLERKLTACRGDLEDADDLATYDQIVDALGELGDTPLGKAALDRAAGAPRATA